MIMMMMVVAVLPVTLLLMDMLMKMRKASVIQRCGKLVYTPRGLERQHELYKRTGDCKDHLRQKSPKTAGVSLHDLCFVSGMCCVSGGLLGVHGNRGVPRKNFMP